MRILNDYIQYLTSEQLGNECGRYGYLLELAVKDYFHKPLVISKAGHIDLTITVNGKSRRCEVKENGGDFRFECKGSSVVAYAVYIDGSKTLAEQFGYMINMPAFKTCGYALNHIRTEKKDKDGNNKMSLQTLYNYKKGDFHGAKAFKLSAMWEEFGAISFKDFFVGD